MDGLKAADRGFDCASDRNSVFWDRPPAAVWPGHEIATFCSRYGYTLCPAADRVVHPLPAAVGDRLCDSFQQPLPPGRHLAGICAELQRQRRRRPIPAQHPQATWPLRPTEHAPLPPHRLDLPTRPQPRPPPTVLRCPVFTGMHFESRYIGAGQYLSTTQLLTLLTAVRACVKRQCAQDYALPSSVRQRVCPCPVGPPRLSYHLDQKVRNRPTGSGITSCFPVFFGDSTCD